MALGTMTWGRDTDADEAATQLLAFTEAGGTIKLSDIEDEVLLIGVTLPIREHAQG